MKKTMEQKGITLVALIVTIVILLIMAVAAINTISSEGIITQANEVVSKHKESVTNETEQMSWLQELLDGKVCKHEKHGVKKVTTYIDHNKHSYKKICKECGSKYEEGEEPHDDELYESGYCSCGAFVDLDPS